MLFQKTCVTETGMSDFHKLTAISLKSQVLKVSPKHKFQRNYKNFDEDNFNKDLKLKLDSLEESDYFLFENIFIDVLNTHAPIETKTLPANSHQFMTKALRKAIMRLKPSRLNNMSLKSRNEENCVKYKRHQNFYTNLLRKTKQKYFCHLNTEDLNDNSVILKDKERLFTDSSIIANTYNNDFINITNILDLKPSMSKSKLLSDLLKLYEDHFSALKIKEKYKIHNKF